MDPLVFAERQKFDSAIQLLLKSENLNSTEYNALSVFPFIKGKLKQFHLDNFNVYDIINEVYIRGVKLIESGQPIRKPFAWIRGTAFNVIREISRNQTKWKLVDYSSVEYAVASEEAKNSLVSEDAINEYLKSLQMSVQELEPKDRQILELWKVKGLSWKEVAKNLDLNGEEVPSLPTLRKRGERALERLRQKYYSMNQSNSSM
jgi:RNA polymerase sigma factor (sigma-70 family)